jgi:hypothetical protein
MQKYLSILFFLFYVVFSIQSQSIEQLLFELPDLSFQKLENDKNGCQIYELKVRQAIDHASPSKGYFYQRVFLSHRSFDAPTVLITEGYSMHRSPKNELTDLLNANQIGVEHRYFGKSLPDSMDYHYLNLKQATADLHYVRQLFDKIYKNKWVSTGISKGGATSIYYKYFFPNDVDLSVPYVAPINKSFEEQNIYNFLDTVGSDECREKIKRFQIKVLENRLLMLPRLKFYAKGAGVKFDIVSLPKAFELSVLELPFSFWQWGHSCNKIPSDTASIDEIADYFIKVSDISFFGDKSINDLGSHYYQAATEMGYYGYRTKDFKHLLHELPTDSNPMALFFPFEMTDKFDGKLLADVNDWLEKKGHGFIYIYGELDTWSASAVVPNNKVDSKSFVLKGKSHGSARISSMTDVEKQSFISTLEQWLSLKIESK